MGPSPKAKTTLTFIQQSAMGSSSTYQLAFGSQGVWTPRRRSLAHLLVSLLVVCLAFEAFRLWTFSHDTALSRVAYKRDVLDMVAEGLALEWNTTVEEIENGPQVADLYRREDVVEVVAQKAYDELQKCDGPLGKVDMPALLKKFKTSYDDYLRGREKARSFKPMTGEDWKKRQIDDVIPRLVEELSSGNATAYSGLCPEQVPRLKSDDEADAFDRPLSRVTFKRHDLSDEIANEAGRVLNTTSKVVQDINDDLHPGDDVVEIVAQKAHDGLQKCDEPSCNIDLSVLEKKFKAMHDDFLKTRIDGVTDEDWKKQQIEVVIPAFVKELKDGNGTSSSISTATGQVASTLVTVQVTKTEVVPGPTGVEATPTRVKRDDGRADAFDRQNSETNSGTPPSKRDDFGFGTIDNALQKRAQPSSATPIPIIPLDNKLRATIKKLENSLIEYASFDNGIGPENACSLKKGGKCDRIEKPSFTDKAGAEFKSMEARKDNLKDCAKLMSKQPECFTKFGVGLVKYFSKNFKNSPTYKKLELMYVGHSKRDDSRPGIDDIKVGLQKRSTPITIDDPLQEDLGMLQAKLTHLMFSVESIETCSSSDAQVCNQLDNPKLIDKIFAMGNTKNVRWANLRSCVGFLTDHPECFKEYEKAMNPYMSEAFKQSSDYKKLIDGKHSKRDPKNPKSPSGGKNKGSKAGKSSAAATTASATATTASASSHHKTTLSTASAVHSKSASKSAHATELAGDATAVSVSSSASATASATGKGSTLKGAFKDSVAGYKAQQGEEGEGEGGSGVGGAVGKGAGMLFDAHKEGRLNNIPNPFSRGPKAGTSDSTESGEVTSSEDSGGESASKDGTTGTQASGGAADAAYEAGGESTASKTKSSDKRPADEELVSDKPKNPAKNAESSGSTSEASDDITAMSGSEAGQDDVVDESAQDSETGSSATTKGKSGKAGKSGTASKGKPGHGKTPAAKGTTAGSDSVKLRARSNDFLERRSSGEPPSAAGSTPPASAGQPPPPTSGGSVGGYVGGGPGTSGPPDGADAIPPGPAGESPGGPAGLAGSSASAGPPPSSPSDAAIGGGGDGLDGGDPSSHGGGAGSGIDPALGGANSPSDPSNPTGGEGSPNSPTSGHGSSLAGPPSSASALDSTSSEYGGIDSMSPLGDSGAADSQAGYDGYGGGGAGTSSPGHDSYNDNSGGTGGSDFGSGTSDYGPMPSSIDSGYGVENPSSMPSSSDGAAAGGDYGPTSFGDDFSRTDSMDPTGMGSYGAGSSDYGTGLGGESAMAPEDSTGYGAGLGSSTYPGSSEAGFSQKNVVPGQAAGGSLSSTTDIPGETPPPSAGGQGASPLGSQDGPAAPASMPPSQKDPSRPSGAPPNTPIDDASGPSSGMPGDPSHPVSGAAPPPQNGDVPPAAGSANAGQPSLRKRLPKPPLSDSGSKGKDKEPSQASGDMDVDPLVKSLETFSVTSPEDPDFSPPANQDGSAPAVVSTTDGETPLEMWQKAAAYGILALKEYRKTTQNSASGKKVTKQMQVANEAMRKLIKCLQEQEGATSKAQSSASTSGLTDQAGPATKPSGSGDVDMVGKRSLAVPVSGQMAAERSKDKPLSRLFRRLATEPPSGKPLPPVDKGANPYETAQGAADTPTADDEEPAGVGQSTGGGEPAGGLEPANDEEPADYDEEPADSPCTCSSSIADSPSSSDLETSSPEDSISNSPSSDNAESAAPGNSISESPPSSDSGSSVSKRDETSDSSSDDPGKSALDYIRKASVSMNSALLVFEKTKAGSDPESEVRGKVFAATNAVGEALEDLRSEEGLTGIEMNMLKDFDPNKSPEYYLQKAKESTGKAFSAYQKVKGGSAADTRALSSIQKATDAIDEALAALKDEGTPAALKRSPSPPNPDAVSQGANTGSPNQDFSALPKGHRTVAHAIERLVSASKAALDAFRQTNRVKGGSGAEQGPVYKHLQDAQSSALAAQKANLGTGESDVEGAGGAGVDADEDQAGSDATSFEQESDSTSCEFSDSECSNGDAAGGAAQQAQQGQNRQSSPSNESPDSMAGSDGGGDIGSLADADSAAAANAADPATGSTGSDPASAPSGSGSGGTAASKGNQPRPGTGFGKGWSNKGGV